MIFRRKKRRLNVRLIGHRSNEGHACDGEDFWVGHWVKDDHLTENVGNNDIFRLFDPHGKVLELRFEYD